jgi:hypothetical protein
VHPDRPLACRLYPLARWTQADGAETFGLLEPHPQTAGTYGRAGVVADYLDAQGLAPYFAMADRYGEVHRRMASVLERVAPEEHARSAERRADMDELDAGAGVSSLMDLDATVTTYCQERALPVPTDVDALVDLHVRAVGVWLDGLEARAPSFDRP